MNLILSRGSRGPLARSRSPPPPLRRNLFFLLRKYCTNNFGRLAQVRNLRGLGPRHQISLLTLRFSCTSHAPWAKQPTCSRGRPPAHQSLQKSFCVVDISEYNFCDPRLRTEIYCRVYRCTRGFICDKYFRQPKIRNTLCFRFPIL